MELFFFFVVMQVVPEGTFCPLVVAMGSEEERVLENQLELQLQEQRDSLSAIDQALLSDPTDPELLAVQLSLSLSLSL